ncbi:MAG: transcriptional repressor [Bacteroidales bacterium]|jgi:Fe2+ or Zn2+ uptake regulation protein|nr:transcriptional repressor [Bacteroidales bacterium]MBR3285087.1 transcriptional repressor [Bacteroidales bacterium]
MQKFKALLKQHKLKATPQRLAVHNVMLQLIHASAEQVADVLKEASESKVSVSSVYNILSQMASLGIYGRRLSVNNVMYFDVNPENHLHLYDPQNNVFKDVQDPDLLMEIEERIKRHRYRGFRVSSVEVNVICHPPKKRKKQS